MHEYDDAVLACFLENQLQLFPEEVASTEEEAESFLEDCMAVVVDSAEDVLAYFDEAGIDMDGADEETILEASEVFDIGDGRYLIVEGQGHTFCRGQMRCPLKQNSIKYDEDVRELAKAGSLTSFYL